MAFGKLHLLILHLPIALILAAGFADLVFLLSRKYFWSAAGFYCVVCGALTAIPTAITGYVLLSGMSLAGAQADIAETHEGLGISVAIVVSVAALIRLIRWNRLKSWWAYLYGLAVAGAVVLVCLAGHYGGVLAFGAGYLK